MSKVEITDDWVRKLSSNRKGEIGEGIAKTHLRSVVEERPRSLFPAFESVDASSLYTQVRHRRRFIYEDVGEDGEIDRIQWQADLTIELRSPYSDTGPRIERTIALEVKTGRYAELERDQRRVMGILNENDDYLVLRANVRFDGESIAEIRYSTLEPDASTKAAYRLVPYDFKTA